MRTEAIKEDVSAYGSFRDSLRAPIHRWFTYPAGYSHRLVECKIHQYELARGDWVADPFLGTGTTSLVAKTSGINSVGVEAHPFVFWVAKTKMNLEHSSTTLSKGKDRVLEKANAIYKSVKDCKDVWPPLVYKCYDKKTLRKLYALRQSILEYRGSPERRDFLKIALTATLRIVSSAGTGWPYIAPSKYAKRVVSRDAFLEFSKRCDLMIQDLESINLKRLPPSKHIVVNGDARNLVDHAPRNSTSLIVTSPPYLNNYDYADRTRLETYFWGIYETWGDITNKVRNALIVAATTQINRSSMNGIGKCPGINKVDSSIHSELQGIIERLSELRMVKGGKKSYDLLAAGYFEDMLKVIQGAYKILKKGAPFILVLGDSAPYGVHIRTDEIIAELALSVGFSEFDIEVIRTRGDKWAGNPQRHNVALRESIVTITK